jgi:hypothetical protein
MKETQETVASRIPKSVRDRFGGKCQTVAEAVTCCSISFATAGVRAALLTAVNVYKIPVQYGIACSIYDLLWLVDCLYGEDRRRKASEGGNGSVTMSDGRKFSREVRAPYVSERDGRVNVVRDNGRMRHSQEVGSCDKFLSVLKNYERWKGHELGKLPVLRNVEQDAWVACSRGCWWEGVAKETDVFPIKFGAATQKINVTFTELWLEVRRFYPDVASIVGRDTGILRGMYNDEACGWLVWMCGVRSTIGLAGVAMLRAYGTEYKMYKELNTYAKALGLQSKEWGPLLCELSTLWGRGVGGLDMEDDIRTRTDVQAFLNEKAAVCDTVRLRECVRKVLAREMTTRPQWVHHEDYWSRRWLYTKSGSHQRRVEDRIYGERLNLPPQPTRREFAENAKDSVVALGDPRVDAGFSEKEEHGKTRAIYGCDSVSYFTFDYLLRPIEGVWNNLRVLLDPGRDMQSHRYSMLAKKRGIRYMLDFDDFNSQHTIEAMKMVTEEVLRDAPTREREWAIASWDNMYVNWTSADGTKNSRRMVGTLPSGHRATTLINTVLNAAYCEYAAEDSTGLESYHCGDDVITFGPERVVSRFVNNVTNSPFRINPSKQSVGFETGEFLRVAFGKREARGYAARAVASMVSGNWVTENSLDEKSYIETLLRNVWTLNARFKTDGLGVLFRESLLRRTSLPAVYALPLLKHEMSWNAGPVAGQTLGKPVEILRCEGGDRKKRFNGLDKTYATDAMISNHVDMHDLQLTGYTPGMLKSILVKASEKPRNFGEPTQLRLRVELSNVWYTENAEEVARIQSRGSKQESEGLSLLRNVLTKVDWKRLAGSLRSTSTYDELQSPWPVVGTYRLPYSDCMNFRRKLSHTAGLVTSYPVMV